MRSVHISGLHKKDKHVDLIIDVTSLLEYMGIDIKYEGKNVGTNDINICCPFCEEDRFHMGINRNSGALNCWSCWLEGEEHRPNLLKLIMKLNDIPFAEAIKIRNDFASEDFGEGTEEDEKPKVTKLSLPKECQSFSKPSEKKWRDKAYKYLTDRGFGDETIKEYGLTFCTSGYFQYRIIIPTYFEGKLVNYTGRTFIEKEGVNRYKNCHTDYVVMKQRDLLYGYDSFEGKHLRLVEGATDRWRIGTSSLGLIRNNMTRVQRSLLIGLGVDSASILLDPGSYSKAVSIAENLSPFIDNLKVIELKGKRDVADRTLDEIKKIEDETDFCSF